MAGEIQIDGVTLATESGGAIILQNVDFSQTWTYRASQATTSGTAFDFTSIPSGTTEIGVVLQNVSLSGTDHLLIQLGDSGGIETTGYQSVGLYQVVGLNTSGGGQYSSSGFVIHMGLASSALYLNYKFRRVNSAGTLWSGSFDGVLSSTAGESGGGIKNLSSELTQLRITRTGSNTFDAGSVFIYYR